MVEYHARREVEHLVVEVGEGERALNERLVRLFAVEAYVGG